MRRLYNALALVLLGIMTCACQIVFFPDYQNQEEEQNPGDDKPQEGETDPILKVKTFGMYSIDGEDYVYRRGFSQISRNYSSDGRSLNFAILDPSHRAVYSLSGIKPSSAQIGHSIYVSFSARTPDQEIKSLSTSAKVIGVSGDTLWLRSTQGPYFVIKK